MASTSERTIVGAGRNRARRTSALLALLLSGLFIGVPAAHAAFTSSARSGFTASTLTLATPTSLISAPCSPIGSSGKFRPTITVSQYGAVPRANAYFLVVTDPTGQVTTIDLSVSNTYSSGQSYGGTWTYYVQSRYQVPGSTNAWKSRAANPASVTC